MIEKIVVAPRDGGSVSLELHGDLARHLALRSVERESPISAGDGAYVFAI